MLRRMLWMDQANVNITDGEGLELRTVLNAGINYLWDYKPCTATLCRVGRASASLPGYPGYRGWFEGAEADSHSGSFNI